MQKPRVSIVLPVHNGEQFLSAAIESCLNQTFTDFELIIVDDKSTDNSAALMRSYAVQDKRILLISNGENIKLPASLNAGFAQASGELYTWTSDDNILEKDFLEKLVGAIEQPNIDIVYSDYLIINENGSVVRTHRAVREENFPIRTGIGASFLYKRKVHDALQGFDTSLFLLEDYDFWIRAYLHKFTFKHLNQVIYRYRIHAGSLTGQKQALIKQETLRYRYELRKKLNTSPHKSILFRLGLLKNGLTTFSLQQLAILAIEIAKETYRLILRGL